MSRTQQAERPVLTLAPAPERRYVEPGGAEATMGYEVHITRADSWPDAETQPIQLEEWLAYVRSDPEMRLDGFAEAKLPDGRSLRVENAGLTVWTAYSLDGEEGNHAWFDFWKGSIVVKNPDQEIISKMFRVATYFGARVQGDDGEDYGDDGDPI